MHRKVSGYGHVGGHTSRSHSPRAHPKTAAQQQAATLRRLLELDEPTHASSAASSSSSSPGAASEAVPPRALLLPKPVSVLAPDANPLANYHLVGPPRSVALGASWAHQVLDVASGACLLALANGQTPPPGCI
jgi:hypothetical protein